MLNLLLFLIVGAIGVIIALFGIMALHEAIKYKFAKLDAIVIFGAGVGVCYFTWFEWGVLL